MATRNRRETDIKVMKRGVVVVTGIEIVMMTGGVIERANTEIEIVMMKGGVVERANTEIEIVMMKGGMVDRTEVEMMMKGGVVDEIEVEIVMMKVGVVERERGKISRSTSMTAKRMRLGRGGPPKRVGEDGIGRTARRTGGDGGIGEAPVPILIPATQNQNRTHPIQVNQRMIR